MSKSSARIKRLARHARVRKRVQGTTERPRLCVFRSLNHIYAQVIDDSAGHTLATASTLEQEIKNQLSGNGKGNSSTLVGTLVAQRAKEKGVGKVAFDRGGFKYQGRVKALAEAARKGGLEF